MPLPPGRIRGRRPRVYPLDRPRNACNSTGRIVTCLITTTVVLEPMEQFPLSAADRAWIVQRTQCRLGAAAAPEPHRTWSALHCGACSTPADAADRLCARNLIRRQHSGNCCWHEPFSRCAAIVRMQALRLIARVQRSDPQPAVRALQPCDSQTLEAHDTAVMARRSARPAARTVPPATRWRAWRSGCEQTPRATVSTRRPATGRLPCASNRAEGRP